MEDVFRKEYKPVSTDIQERVMLIKIKAEDLLKVIEDSEGDPRMKALAKTNLEQSIMWAVKAITK